MVMATVAVAMMVKLKIDDSREALRSILQAASAWTMESTEDLQSMAESIASVSPPLRVTFLMEQGLVLADSEADALAMENHASRPEVQAALQGGIGESLRFSDTQAMLTLYARHAHLPGARPAPQLSPVGDCRHAGDVRRGASLPVSGAVHTAGAGRLGALAKT